MDIDTLNALANITQVPVIVAFLIWLLRRQEKRDTFLEKLIDRVINGHGEKDDKQ